MAAKTVGATTFFSERSRSSERSRRPQSGFTLVEVTVSLAVAAMIVATVVGAFILVNRANRSSVEGLSSSNAVFQTGSRFADDVTSVGPVAGVTQPVQVDVAGCGGATAKLVLVGPNPTGGVLVRSHHVVGAGPNATLERRECQGATFAAALAAAPLTGRVVVPELDPGPDAVQVTCDGAVVSGACRVVEMAVTTSPGRTFEVRGTIDTSLSPTPTTTPAPVIAPPSGTCTLAATATTWGATGGQAGSSGSNHNGDASMYTYNDTNQRYSFIKVDLTGPCIGGGDSWPTLPGGRTLTGATLHLAYLGKSGSSIGISNNGQRLQTLNDAATWNEATLTGSNMPSGVRSGTNYDFNVANQGSRTAHSNATILSTVQQWYQPGGWVNNGWRLGRSSVGDTLGRSNRFASRFDANPALRPILVVTWGL